MHLLGHNHREGYCAVGARIVSYILIVGLEGSAAAYLARTFLMVPR